MKISKHKEGERPLFFLPIKIPIIPIIVPIIGLHAIYTFYKLTPIFVSFGTKSITLLYRFNIFYTNKEGSNPSLSAKQPQYIVFLPPKTTIFCGFLYVLET